MILSLRGTTQEHWRAFNRLVSVTWVNSIIFYCGVTKTFDVIYPSHAQFKSIIIQYQARCCCSHHLH